MSRASSSTKGVTDKAKSAAAKAAGATVGQARKAGSGVAKSAAFIYGNAKDTVKTTPRAAKNLATQPVATVKGAAKGVKNASLNNTVGLKKMQQKRGVLKTVTSAGMMASGAGIVMAASQGAAHIPAKGVTPATTRRTQGAESDFEKAARKAK